MTRENDNWTKAFDGKVFVARRQEASAVDQPAKGRDSPEGGRGAWHSPEDIPLAVVVAAKARLNLTSLNRSTFAQAIFPYKEEYGSHGQWSRLVGSWVAGDIKNDPLLRQRMALLKYVPRQKGYSQQEIEVLVRHYLYNGTIREMKE